MINQKGGVGKTTTVANLGAALAETGQRVLLVDADPQANLSIHFGTELSPGDPSLYTLVRGEDQPADVVRTTCVRGLELVPASIDLAGLGVEISDRPDRLLVMRRALERLPGPYDYMLVDSPPSLGILALNAVSAVEEVFIPLQTEFFALQGLGKLLHTLGRVKRAANNSLRLTGVVACKHDARTCLGKEILEDIRGHFGSRVFKTIVRQNVRLAEAPGFGLPITQYDPECHGAEDYRALAREVIAMESAGRENRRGTVQKMPPPPSRTDAKAG